MPAARIKGCPTGQMTGTPNHNEHSGATEIFGNLVQANSLFQMRKLLQYGHSLSSKLPSQS